MNLQRIARHLLATHRQVHKAFPQQTLLAIEDAIITSKSAHVGEICFAVEGALDGVPLLKGQSAHERALEVFSQLRVWDTEHNNGVLIYLLLADRDVEIVADRAVHARVGTQEWEALCRQMEAEFRQGHYREGVVNGIQAVTRHLAAHFPASSTRGNDLADKPVLL